MTDSIGGESKLVEMAREYAHDVRPTRIQRKQFTALMLGQFPILSMAQQTDIANALCLCNHLDREVALLIAEAKLEISGRFLRFNPLLDDAMLTALISNTDDQRKLSIARRRDLSKTVARLLREEGDQRINRALDLRQIAKTQNKAVQIPAQATVDTIISAARSRDLNALCDVLMQRLSITRESAFVLLAEKSSANLIIALKYCGLDADQAWETYTLLAPGMAEKNGQKEAFFASYNSYGRDMCTATVKNWILDDLLARVTAPPLANDDLGQAIKPAFDDASGLRKSA